MRPTICYHMRSWSNPSHKLCGGMTDGTLSMETAEKLIRFQGLKVRIKNGGTPVFVDRHDRELYLYFSIDPGETEMGKEALKLYRRERQREADEAREKDEEIQRLLNGMTREEALLRLKGES